MIFSSSSRPWMPELLLDVCDLPLCPLARDLLISFCVQISNDENALIFLIFLELDQVAVYQIFYQCRYLLKPDVELSMRATLRAPVPRGDGTS